MYIQRIYMNNTKIANELRKYDKRYLFLNRIDVGNKKASLKISYSIGDDLTCYDCAVADAVYTLYKNNYNWFSERQVLQALSGDETQTLTEQKRIEIRESIEKLCSLDLRIDCTEEMRARELISEDEEKLLDGRFLSLDKKGKKYHLKNVKDMPLYHYAEMNTQMISVPMKYLDVYFEENGVRKRLTNTKENILIKRYLLRRLEVMKNSKNSMKGRKISYVWEDRQTKQIRGMLAELEIRRENFGSEEAWRHKLLHVHGVVKKILDYYQKELKYIEGYEVVKGPGGIIMGVRITGSITEE